MVISGCEKWILVIDRVTFYGGVARVTVVLISLRKYY